MGTRRPRRVRPMDRRTSADGWPPRNTPNTRNKMHVAQASSLPWGTPRWQTSALAAPSTVQVRSGSTADGADSRRSRAGERSFPWPRAPASGSGIGIVATKRRGSGLSIVIAPLDVSQTEGIGTRRSLPPFAPRMTNCPAGPSVHKTSFVRNSSGSETLRPQP